ncbi:MAG TPA: maleylpyruvate isomerase family mycothiol-dependent enzyme [Streptosporangiaceae bacterium]|nr:maleylpyruvate isomerase family mycothiol-dependent enzyme [Streptosporangiaceae bacterium]
MTTTTMTGQELTQAIAAERQELADLLAGLPPEAWDAPTLCAGWRVRELVAHVTMPFRYSTAKFMAELIRSGGRFHAMADRCARRDAAAIAASGLRQSLLDNVENPWRPPGGGQAGALTHDVIHGLDLAVPLGIGRRVPRERLLIVLQAITEPRALKHFGAHLTGIELRAEDMDWSFGAGDQVSGLAQDLALVVCGRKLPPGHLHGAQAARLTAG